MDELFRFNVVRPPNRPDRPGLPLDYRGLRGMTPPPPDTLLGALAGTSSSPVPDAGAASPANSTSSVVLIPAHIAAVSVRGRSGQRSGRCLTRLISRGHWQPAQSQLVQQPCPPVHQWYRRVAAQQSGALTPPQV